MMRTIRSGGGSGGGSGGAKVKAAACTATKAGPRVKRVERHGLEAVREQTADAALVGSGGCRWHGHRSKGEEGDRLWQAQARHDYDVQPVEAAAVELFGSPKG